MSDALENALRDALQPCDPPPELAQRLGARIAALNRKPPRRRWLPAVALGLATLLCAAGALIIRQRRTAQREQAEQARARLIFALRITTRELSWAQRKLQAVQPATLHAPAQNRSKPPEVL